MDRPNSRVLVLGITDPVSTLLIDGLPQALSNDGWDVNLVVGGRPDVPGALVHEIPMYREPAPRSDIGALIAWVRLLRRTSPTVVISGTPKAGLLGMLAAWVCRVPVRIYHLRGLRLETSNGPLGRLLAILEWTAMWCATEVLSVSESLVDECVRRHLAPRHKFRVLGSGSSNGVDVRRFEPVVSPRDVEAAKRALGLALDSPVIGYVGRLTDSKGLDVLVDAVRSFGSSVPVQVLLVGSEEQRGYGARLARELERSEVRCVVTGAIRVQASTYHAMDVLCLPSLREGFPNVALEAAASGVAVVTTSATGCRDAVLPGRTGWIATVGHSGELSTALREAIGDPDERSRRAAAGRDWIVAAFEREAVHRLLVNYLSSASATVRDSRSVR